jgi:hypothetical protein
MGEHGRSPPPSESVTLESKGPEDGGRGGQRVERAEEVVREPRLGQLGATDGAARVPGPLEHHDAPARVREDVGGHETVRPCSDDDRIRHVARIWRLGGRTP